MTAIALAPISAKASAVARHGGIAPTRFERLPNENYFTLDAPWIIPALLSRVKILGPVLEPAAGVGHMVRELRRGYGFEVVASDLIAYPEPLIPDIEVRVLDEAPGGERQLFSAQLMPMCRRCPRRGPSVISGAQRLLCRRVSK